MQPGSLVVVLPYEEHIPEWLKPYLTWLPRGDEKTPYIVRAIGTCKECPKVETVIFEEGEMGRNPETGEEFGLDINYVREIQDPHEVDALELVEEALLLISKPPAF